MLSPSQARLSFLEQLTPGEATYHIPRALRLTGPLDELRLRRALERVAGRHGALRTTFRLTPEGLRQVVGAEARIDWSERDLHGVPSDLDRILTEEAARPFDLADGPLLRASLLRTGPDERVLLFTVHHLVCDGWSLTVFFREVSALYNGDPEPAPAVQFSDWQRDQAAALDPAERAEHLAFWKEHLAGAQASLALPADVPRPVAATCNGGMVPFRLSPALFAALRELARSERATPFMAMMAGFNALLGRLCAADEATVGFPIANREGGDLAGSIGFFANTLVLRTDLSGDPTFRELLRRVRAGSLAVYEHAETPLDAVVEAVRPARAEGAQPLFHVGLAYMEDPDPYLALAGVAIAPVPAHTATAKWDLLLSLEESAAGLGGFLEYSADLFDHAGAERLVARLTTLLESAVAAPDMQVARLGVLPEAERRQIAAWNGREVDFRTPETLVQIFERRAQAAPDAVAVTWQDQSLTYSELDRRANQLAHLLQRWGVRTETRVGVCMQRSADLIVALLGVLKAGGAYLPLDPASPPERRAYMLRDGGAPVLISDAGLADELPEHPARVLRLDADGALLAGSADTAPAAAAGPDNLAYVIYTSGSTGAPKGVEVTHGNVTRLFTATDGWFGFGPDDVWTLFHSYAFDFSVWELWGALLYGGRLVVAPHCVTRSPEQFHALLRREGVTVLNQTPSAFRQLIRADAEAPAPAAALRLVVFGGEALDLQSLRPWFARHGDQKPRLVNMYGITETTVHVTYRPISVADVERGAGSVIGCPIPDLTLRVVDRNFQPAPIGVPGELLVGGAGVARGYLGRPELTAERFIPDPEAPASRLYRSGDLVRRLPDGDLEYLGRIDHQVKIRGHRIELGEIEALIAARPDVAETAVILREDTPGDQRLVGYYAADREQDVPALKASLRERLPDYMVPVHFVRLERLPLTNNGKLDRAALPAPAVRSAAEPGRGYAPARTPLERQIAAVWQDVLKTDLVGIDDNFFDLGGHSLLVVEVQTRLRAALNRDVTVVQLFQRPTIRTLAASLEPAPAQTAASHSPASGAVPTRSTVQDRAARQREALARARAAR